MTHAFCKVLPAASVVVLAGGVAAERGESGPRSILGPRLCGGGGAVFLAHGAERGGGVGVHPQHGPAAAVLYAWRIQRGDHDALARGRLEQQPGAGITFTGHNASSEPTNDPKDPKGHLRCPRQLLEQPPP